MDRPESLSLGLGSRSDADSRVESAGAVIPEAAAAPRKLLGLSVGAVRNILTTVIVGAVLAGLVHFFASPTASASQAVTLSAEASGPAPKVGQPAPDFEATTPDGKTVHLSDFKGKAVWITFWASWCPPCRAENPDVQAAYVAHQADGLVVLAVNLGEDTTTVQQYAQRTGLTFPIALDPPTQIAASYHVMGIPSHFFIDANGILIDERLGGMSRTMMEQKIQELLKSVGASGVNP